MTINESELRELVAGVLSRCTAVTGSANTSSANTGSADKPHSDFAIEASARHVHLTVQAVETLFGQGARLTPKRGLSQPGEFLSQQRVRLITTKGELVNVAVLGPERDAVQVELSMTDARALGINAPVNLSGDLRGAGDVYLMGDSGLLYAPSSVIAARAHIHMTPADALRLGVADGQTVHVRVHSRRPITFESVQIRVKDSFALAMHIDFDEANACCLGSGTCGSIVIPERQRAGT